VTPLHTFNAQDFRPIIRGGVGGGGGRGLRGNGGHGGRGEAAQMRLDDAARFREIHGGAGGLGGEGGENGGEGGIGEGNKFGQGLRMMEESPAADGCSADPEVTLLELKQKFKLGSAIYELLAEEGYDTVAGLLEATDGDLMEAGLKKGQINQLKAILRKVPPKYAK
ncbi:hypothetical protein B0H12DRAFT_1166044, partial [Mycena haematopus]